jgi:hypothetical protein
MLRLRHLLIVFGLIGLMAVPGLVRALAPEDSCAASWEGPTERSCGFVSGNRITVFAAAQQGSGTVRALELVDGVEHTLVYCSFGAGSGSKTPPVEPSPVSVWSLTTVSPAPIAFPTVAATITPPAIAGRTLPGSPGSCSARVTSTPLREMACRVNGAGKGVFGCTGLAN